MDADGPPARLECDDATPTVAAFPDGSVDTFCRVSAGGEPIDTRESFADAVSTGSADVFSVHRETVEPGGHAVDLGEGADRLGNDVTVAGHFDDLTFDDLPYETVSMGEPASVSVYGFDDGDVLAVENSADLEGWTLADLDAAFGGRDELAMEAFLTSDVVCRVNWTSIPGPGGRAPPGERLRLVVCRHRQVRDAGGAGRPPPGTPSRSPSGPVAAYRDRGPPRPNSTTRRPRAGSVQ